MAEQKKYKACVYARLSQEDGDKAESDSITSQKALVRDFISGHPEIQVVSEKADDGYSGVNFERPAFQEMMEEIRAGKVNCVVVKDLSRFGRNYIEAGNYIEKVFPFLGVRFIAVNDDYDSDERRHSDSLIVPFKNLINDAYCKDISVKIRTQLEIKRKKGQYTGPNAVYGYRKDENDHNHLVPDPYAAEVVRAIFQWRMKGMSDSRIADKLNLEGVLSPLEYKLQNGVGVQTHFRSGEKALWRPMSVRRVLENEVYTGVLVQGKSATPNYKVKKNFPKDKEEWIRVEGTHEPIIDRKEYQEVQNLMRRDVRSAPGKEYVYPFSGYLVCADCGQNLTRMSVRSGGKEYCYYICSGYRNGKGCTSHRIPDATLESIVLEAVRMRIRIVAVMEKVIRNYEKQPETKAGMKDEEKYDRQILLLKEEIQRSQRFKMKLYENLLEGTINQKDYEVFRDNYERKIEAAEDSIRKVEKEKEMLFRKNIGDHSWMTDVRKYKNIQKIERRAVVDLLDRIVIGEEKKVEVVFRYEEEFEIIRRFVEGLQEQEELEKQAIHVLREKKSV